MSRKKCGPVDKYPPLARSAGVDADQLARTFSASEGDHAIAGLGQSTVVGDHQHRCPVGELPQVVEQGGRGRCVQVLGRLVEDRARGASRTSSRASAIRRASPPETSVPCRPTSRSSWQIEPSGSQGRCDLCIGGIPVADPSRSPPPRCRTGTRPGPDSRSARRPRPSRPSAAADPVMVAAMVVFPHPLGPTRATRLRAGRDGDHRITPGQPARPLGSRPGQPTAEPRAELAPVGRRGRAARTCRRRLRARLGRVPTTGASSTSRTRPRATRDRASASHGGRQRGEHLVQRERGEDEHGQLDRRQGLGRNLARADRQGRHHGKGGGQHLSRSGQTAGPGRLATRPVAVGRRHRPSARGPSAIRPRRRAGQARPRRSPSATWASSPRSGASVRRRRRGRSGPGAQGTRRTPAISDRDAHQRRRRPATTR